MSAKREIDQDDILSLVHCAEDYGHWNDVCMLSLYDWAKPVTDGDIERYAKDLSEEDGYGQEDYDSAKEQLAEWRDKYEAAELFRNREGK